LLAVIALSLLNVFGLVLGKFAQNLLTILKTAGLLGVIVVGIGWGLTHGVAWTPAETPADFTPGWGFALIMILYAFGGWNDASFVAAEVRNRERNLPWALIGGVGAITVIYLLVNLGYLMGLGFDGAAHTDTPAALVFKQPFGQRGYQVMLLLVMVSALGGVNGLVLTGSRVHASLGADHRLFAWLGRWHPRWNSPVASLVTQAGVTLGLMTIVGTAWGQRQLDALNNGLGFEPLNWGKYGGGFGLLITTTAPVFWFFFFLTGTALIVLRWKDPETERPFRAPFFPVLPLIFCGTCVYMFHASIEWAGTLALIPLVPLSLGIALYFASQLMGDERQA
jgi:amino acid transporter